MNKEVLDECIEYMVMHLSDDLTVENIAQHFHYSEYYFCREFKRMTGKSVYQFLKTLKMDQSAVDIKLRKEDSITEIGLHYGYSSSNYSSAFKNHHRISPKEFRKSMVAKKFPSPFYAKARQKYDTYEAYAKKIRILELPDQRVAYERVIGNYVDLKKKWVQFLDRNQEIIHENTEFLERFYNDPSITDPNSCIYDICMTIENENEKYGEVLLPKPLNTTMIEGGKFAVYTYEGRIEDIFYSVQGVFSIWLPNSGFQMTRTYAFNIYSKMDVENNCICMDLYIPIQWSKNSEVMSKKKF